MAKIIVTIIVPTMDAKTLQAEVEPTLEEVKELVTFGIAEVDKETTYQVSVQ